MAGESACPVCGAGIGTPRAACWLCKHPIPERILPAAPPPKPAVPLDPGPAFHRSQEDSSELDRTSLCIAIGLAVATLGAFGVNSGSGMTIAIVSLLPVLYLGIDFVQQIREDSDGVPPPPRPLNARLVKVIKVLAITVGVVVLVPMAIFGAFCVYCLFGLKNYHP